MSTRRHGIPAVIVIAAASALSLSLATWIAMPWPGAAGTALARATSTHTVRNNVWGVEVAVPGFEASEHPLNAQSNFVLAANSNSRACSLNLSLFVSQGHEDGTAEDCRASDIGDPDVLAERSDVTVVDQSSSPDAWTQFDRVLESRGGAQATYHQLYGYFSRKDLCFTLRVSAGEECQVFPKRAMSILHSVHLLADTGATLETAEFAKRRGGDARDWKLHLLVAEAYMHDESHRNPERARRFYASALRLAGPRMKAPDRLNAEQGIGLTWLAEDNGEEAIPHLERALHASKRTGGAAPQSPHESETLYALASAHALEGDVDAACLLARTWLQAQASSDLKAAAKRIRKDPQMEALSGSDCYQTLLSDLGLR
jgi:hypothetical protein